jgi:hypothetical protein
MSHLRVIDTMSGQDGRPIGVAAVGGAYALGVVHGINCSLTGASGCTTEGQLQPAATLFMVII